MTVQTKVPKGWVKTGAKEKNFIIGTAEGISHTGKRSGYLESRVNTNGAFGTLMQGVKADQFKGGQLKLTGWIKTEDVTGWAGMWLRVDGDKAVHKKPLEFYNMNDNPITDTTDWTRYEIVLPVDPSAKAIAFGVMLCGAGTVYCDDFGLQSEQSSTHESFPLDDEVELDSYVNEFPINLDFEE